MLTRKRPRRLAFGVDHDVHPPFPRRIALLLLAVLATGCSSLSGSPTSFAGLMEVNDHDRALLRHDSGKGIHDASISTALNGFVIFSEVADYPEQKSLYITKDGVLLAVVNENALQLYNQRGAHMPESAKADIREDYLRYSSATHTLEDHGLDGTDVIYSHSFKSTNTYGVPDGRQVLYGGAFTQCRPLRPDLPHLACCTQNGVHSAWRFDVKGWTDISLNRSPATRTTVAEQCAASPEQAASR